VRRGVSEGVGASQLCHTHAMNEESINRLWTVYTSLDVSQLHRVNVTNFFLY